MPAEAGAQRMKILLVDDHRLFCEGICHLLAQLDDDIEVLKADRCDTAISLAESRPDLSLVMLDIAMPDMDGCDAMRIFSARCPTLPVVMLTASDSARDMRRAFDAGASGYIPKSSSASVMLSALRLVLTGGIYVPPSLVGISDIQPVLPDSAGTNDRNRFAPDKLTARQKEVLQLLQEGMSNKQIAARMALSEATVKVHMSAILKALGVHSRTEAALKARALLDGS